MHPMVLPPWHEVVEAMCIGLLSLLPLLRLWPALDRRSRVAARLQWLWGQSTAGYLCPILFGTIIFVIAAEDVLDGDPNEFFRRLDHLAREAFRRAASDPALHRVARVVSDLTGAGLGSAVAVGVLCLTVVGRRRDALVLAAGTVGAWIVSGLPKAGFGVARPRPALGYGFPSGHALVTLVACGLLLWALSPLTSPPMRFGRCYTTALFVGVLAGVSRIMLDVHWVSEVIGGLAVGTVCLNAVVLVVSRSPGMERPASARARPSRTRRRTQDNESRRTAHGTLGDIHPARHRHRVHPFLRRLRRWSPRRSRPLIRPGYRTARAFGTVTAGARPSRDR